MFEAIYHHVVIKKDISRLFSVYQERIDKAIGNKLLIDPSYYASPLKGVLSGHRSFRVGVYRVICRVKGKQVIIISIIHRAKSYIETVKRLSR